jgi:hypothetical protein
MDSFRPRTCVDVCAHVLFVDCTGRLRTAKSASALEFLVFFGGYRIWLDRAVAERAGFEYRSFP